MSDATPRIYVIHENDAWTDPIREALERRGAPFEDWHLDRRASVDLREAPASGVYYSRMSASAHTRGHARSQELCGCLLAHLERHQRRVLNGSRALAIEMSKVAQAAALSAHGIPTPEAIAATTREGVIDAARALGGQLVLKPNRGGTGVGVALFEDPDALSSHIESLDDEAFAAASPDGVLVVQRYVAPPVPEITRVELIGRQLCYAVRVDTQAGFQLCPADACEIDLTRPRFALIDGFDHPLVPKMQDLMRAHDIHVAAFEMVQDRFGQPFVYDINTNTNYNRPAEQSAEVLSAYERLADYLLHELAYLGREREPWEGPGAFARPPR